MQDRGTSSVKILTHTWEKKERQGKGRRDWKINGVCDWQPMILGIRLNWITERESAGHDPRIAWDTLIVNIQERFPPSVSITGLQGLVTKYFISFGVPKPWDFSNPDSFCQEDWQLADTMRKSKFLSLDLRRVSFYLSEHQRIVLESLSRWGHLKTNCWMNKKPVKTEPWKWNVISRGYTKSSSHTDRCMHKLCGFWLRPLVLSVQGKPSI